MKKIYTLTLGLALFASLTAKAQNNVGINTSSPDVSAVLDVKSTTQGLLIPRMTKAQRDVINLESGLSKPATGLLIYQIDNTSGFYFYDGTTWTMLKASGNTGDGLVNGTAGGQVYLTSPIAPYAVQSPSTLTGDVTLSGTGVTTIANSAITSSKIAEAAVTTDKISATGTASSTTYLRGDGSWSEPASAIGTNTSVYAARKSTGISLLSLGLFPSGFRAVNFLIAERTIGSAALFSDTDNTYTIPSNGVYQISYSFKYGQGLQSYILANSPGPGILRTRAGVSTVIDSHPFSAANMILMSITISEATINSLYTFQAGDKISLGLVGSSVLDVGLLALSKASFSILKVGN